jgi:hypothetical protein
MALKYNEMLRQVMEKLESIEKSSSIQRLPSI